MGKMLDAQGAEPARLPCLPPAGIGHSFVGVHIQGFVTLGYVERMGKTMSGSQDRVSCALASVGSEPPFMELMSSLPTSARTGE